MLNEVINLNEDDVAIILELIRNQGIRCPDLISFYLNIARATSMFTLFKRMGDKPFEKDELMTLVGKRVLCEDKKERTIVQVAKANGNHNIFYVAFDTEPNTFFSYNRQGMSHTKGYRIYLIEDDIKPASATPSNNAPEYLKGIPLLTDFEQDID